MPTTRPDRPELPPRARRIPNTIAHNQRHPRNYLRVRGEYPSPCPPSICGAELPPRARRIPSRLHMAAWHAGTTSACAENTDCLRRTHRPKRNYLRVRGEYGYTTGVMTRMRELPPRARRIRGTNRIHFSTQGTTSACAENTGCGTMFSLLVRNYLRVRGEYAS